MDFENPDVGTDDFVLLTSDQFTPAGPQAACPTHGPYLEPQGTEGERIALVCDSEDPLTFGVAPLWNDDPRSGPRAALRVPRGSTTPLTVLASDCPHCGNDWPTLGRSDGSPVPGQRCLCCGYPLAR